MAVGRGNGAVAADGDAADEEPEDSPRIAAKPVVFTHCRQSLASLHAPAAFKRDGPMLSYTLYRSECAVLQSLLEDNGFVESGSPFANLIWCGSHVKPALLLGLLEYQKVNHFPSTNEITRKDLLVRTLQAMRERYGGGVYDFLPATYVLPADTEALLAVMGRDKRTWIVKPIASSRGRGISLVQHAHMLPADDVVVSRYVERPLLIDGYKFDLRLYVGVSAFEPLRAYVYEEGLARFSTEPYVKPDGASLHNQFVHLTNYSINKHSSRFVANTDAEQDDCGNKWSLGALRRCLVRHTNHAQTRSSRSVRSVRSARVNCLAEGARFTCIECTERSHTFS